VNPAETAVMGLLSCLVLVSIVWGHVRSPRWPTLVLSLVGLFLYLFLLRLLFGFPVPHVQVVKSSTQSNFLPVAAAMFVFMVLGMVAESFYHYFDTPAQTRRFDLGTFVKPFLVSPLVFMPSSASLENANLDL